MLAGEEGCPDDESHADNCRQREKRAKTQRIVRAACRVKAKRRISGEECSGALVIVYAVVVGDGCLIVSVVGAMDQVARVSSGVWTCVLSSHGLAICSALSKLLSQDKRIEWEGLRCTRVAWNGHGKDAVIGCLGKISVASRNALTTRATDAIRRCRTT